MIDPYDTEETEVTQVTEPISQVVRPQAGPPCLVQLYGPHRGQRVALEKNEIFLGRSSSCTIQIDEEGISRRHFVLLKDGYSVTLRDLKSTNGTYVNDESVTEIALRSGDLIRVGRSIFKYLVGDDIESQYHEEIYRLTTTDALTNAANKRHFLERLESELGRARRYRQLVSLAFLDIDHFKKVNDTHGHLAGDYILRELGKLIAGNLRIEDLFARYGGEEFALILPHVDVAGAVKVCEKIRELIAAHPFEFHGTLINITISQGVCCYDGTIKKKNAVSPEEFIGDADKLLYRAKNEGRNRVIA